MKILWLSWRDIKNPDSGGAEKVAFEIAKRLVKNGKKVTIFTSHFEDSKSKETINGVEIIRSGGLITCRFKAFLYYLKHQDLDVIVDEINTIPFFTPLFAKSKSICLIHQLAKEYWFVHTIYPINLIGYLTEPFFLKKYQNVPTITVSRSTKSDLQKLGFKNVSIIREGLSFKPQFIKNKAPKIVFIGRLTKAKKTGDAIKAFNIINRQFKKYILHIVGAGDSGYIRKLKNLTKKLGLRNKVVFEGFISEENKIKLLKKSKITLIPTLREGWNLVATESQALGSVPVGYNVPGLRDSIKNHKTGILTSPNPQALAQSTLVLLKNEKERLKLAKNGFKFSRSFNWQNSYEDFLNILKNTFIDID